MSTASGWQIESLRLTAFPAQGAEHDTGMWWSAVVGGDPEEIRSKPKEAFSFLSGNFLGGSLQLQAQPGRVDWQLVTSPAAQEASEERIPVLGGMGVADRFAQAMASWFAHAPGLNRIAFGIVAMEFVEDRAAGYRRLDRLLPSVTIDAENSSDFLYQINRPVKSAVLEERVLNRVAKWTVASIRPMTIKVQASQPVATTVSAQSDVVRVEVDVNNVPQQTADLPGDSIVGLFRELVGLGRSIVEGGDRV